MFTIKNSSEKNILVDFDVRGQHVKDFLPEEAFLWIRTPILVRSDGLNALIMDLFLTNTAFHSTRY